MVDRLLAAGKHVLCVGETGTGKTLNVANKLMTDMPPEVGSGPYVLGSGRGFRA